MTYTFDKVVKLVIGLTITVCILLLINYLSSVLIPFVLGWLLAYLMNPLVDVIQNKLRVRNRLASIFAALTAIFCILIGVAFIFVPMIVSEIEKGQSLIMEYMQHHSNPNSENNTIIHYLTIALNELVDSGWLTQEKISEAIASLLPHLKMVISGTWQFVAGVFVFFVIMLYTIFILKDYRTISADFRNMIPQKYKQTVEGIIEDVEKGMNSYFRGQLLVAAITGILFAIGLKMVGLPLGITMGIFIGVLNIVPYLELIAILPVTLLALLQSAETGESFWVIIGLCLAVFLIIQALKDLFLIPKIMGRAMGLNPAIILLSLSIGGALLGVIGMIIALPAATLLISYYKRYILHH